MTTLCAAMPLLIHRKDCVLTRQKSYMNCAEKLESCSHLHTEVPRHWA
jgi:hypothetical protein